MLQAVDLASVLLDGDLLGHPVRDRFIERDPALCRTSKETELGTNLFVGNLPYSMSEQDLIDLFGQVGQVVSAQVIFDRTTRRSRGFGFVQMGDETGAAAAIERFHQSEINGRPLTVNEAKPREDRPKQNRW